MLEALRRATTGWLAKGLLGLLIISFAAWGIEDWVRGVSRGTVAAVGEQQISQQEFQRAFQNEVTAIREGAGRQGDQLSPEEVTQISRNPFFVDRVLNRLVAGAALDQHAKEMGLALSDATIAENIKEDPEFKGLDGKFSKPQFEQFLDLAGLSEQGFLALKRRDELRERLTRALIDGVTVPKALLEMQHEWREETRTVEHFKFDAEKAVTVADPDEAKLKETYEQNKRQFVTPERRKVAILLLTMEALKKQVPVTDEEVKAAYLDTKSTYDVPERRRIQQISFKDKAAADAAKTAIDGGKAFTQVAEESGAKPSDIELGVIAKSQMIDPKIADVAFSIDRDKVSDVIEGRFTPVLIRVTEIQPGKESTLDQVKDKVRDKLAREKANVEVQKVFDQVEDNRLAGKTLEEIGNMLKLGFIEIAATDAANKSEDGTTAFPNANAELLIAAAFRAQPGLETEAVELIDGGYGWVDVLAITESKQKPFEEVKEEVKNVYIASERSRLANELAAKLADRATAGEPMDKLAGEVGSKPETTLPITRATLPQGLTQTAVTQAFSLGKGTAGTAVSEDGKSRIVFRVLDIKPAPAPTAEQLANLSRDIGRQIQNDALDQYVLALRDRLGVVRNDAEIKRLTGQDQQQ